MNGKLLSEILQELRESPDFRTTIPPEWSQGRSAFGGLTAALAVTAMKQTLGQVIPIRSLMASFIAPLPPGEARVKCRVMRQGKNVTQLFAEVVSGESVCLQAMGVFGQDRQTLSLPQPKMPNKLGKEGVSFEAHKKRTPRFLEYFEGFWLGKGMPFAGTCDHELQIWVRHREPMTGFAEEAVVAIADVPPPVILSHYLAPPVPASSLTWSLEFTTPPGSEEIDWCLLDFEVDAASSGYTQQSGKVFSEEGKLLALTRQTMVYFDQVSRDDS